MNSKEGGADQKQDRGTKLKEEWGHSGTGMFIIGRVGRSVSRVPCNKLQSHNGMEAGGVIAKSSGSSICIL